MLFKRSHINKAVSAMLLVMLLFIHSIKLLHSHSSDKFCTESNLEIVKSSADCGICSYQLGNDADDLVYPAIRESKFEPISFNSSSIFFHKVNFHTAFENRGPPAI